MRPVLGRGTLVVAASATSAGGSLVLPPTQLAAAKLLYATSGAPAHFYPGHSETPERVPAILKVCVGEGGTLLC